MFSISPQDGAEQEHNVEERQLSQGNRRSTTTQEGKSSDPGCPTKNASRALPDDFCPTPYTVIIGKGKMIRENLGNKRLRILASNFLARYSESNEKRSKTMVVNELIDSIRSAGGSFVRKEKDGRWYQTTEQAIREKIGYVFRDLLCDKYRSSSKSKAVKRQKEQLGRASVKLERAMRLTNSGDSGIPTSILFFNGNQGMDDSRKKKQEEEQNKNATDARGNVPSFLQDYK